MNEKILFSLKSLYREAMDVRGFEFGTGEKSVCIVGSTRGNEVQQTYICSLLVNALKKAEYEGRIVPGKSILIVPTINSYSLNIGKRFWSTDNSDINRMFPGYNLGETTQRIAAGVFNEISEYKYGIQFASFYIPGKFLPHVKIMETEYCDTETAKLFSLPYVVLRKPRPYDTTTLNYNWQIWDTKAFSLYASSTEHADEEDAVIMLQSVITFLIRIGVLIGEDLIFGKSVVVSDKEFVSVHAKKGGIFLPLVRNRDFIREGEILAVIRNSLTGEIQETITAPVTGHMYYTFRSSMSHQGTLLFQLIPR